MRNVTRFLNGEESYLLAVQQRRGIEHRRQALNQTRETRFQHETRTHRYTERPPPRRSQLREEACNRSTRPRERIYRGHRVYDASRHKEDNRRLIGSLRLKRVRSIEKKLRRTGFLRGLPRLGIGCDRTGNLPSRETLVGNGWQISVRAIFVRFDVVNPRSRLETTRYSVFSCLSRELGIAESRIYTPIKNSWSLMVDAQEESRSP